VTRCACLIALMVAVCPVAAQAQDTDGDGVPNTEDICPVTRAGRTVDLAGCDDFCEVVDDTLFGSVFMRSRLLEVGTANWGSFGSVNLPPLGWHPRFDDIAGLGFTANPADDDWANFQGDFFIPGTPEEGFGLHVASVGTDRFTSFLMGERGITGDFTGTRVECRPNVCGVRGGGSVYWSGSVDGIDVDQTYSVFNEGLFILVEVTLTNTTAAEQTVYYMRNVDPDNMVTVSGDYSTQNTIVSQGTGADPSLALVSATTFAPFESYIALASSDPDARVTYGGFSVRDVDGVWNCTGLTCAVGSTEFDDIAISLAVRKIIPAGESRTFSYVYTLSEAALAESVACTVPAVCGDGNVEGTEGCDDSNLVDGDGCDASCDVEPGYTCTDSPSVCTPICGDGTVLEDEDCDDGNDEADDGCSASCTVEPGWTCEGEPSACEPICGDSIMVGTETCDAGSESSGCDDDCTAVACGDSNLNETAGEDCDDGNLDPGDGCSATCDEEGCGNGIVEAGEDCDDDGESADCDDDCSAVMCGDDNANATAGEGCDDGNTTSGDGCSETCEPEGCGDGVVNGTEDCDESGESADCDDDCTDVACGDGNSNALAGEGCDDGNTSDGDGCSATCALEAGIDGGGGDRDAGPRRYGVSGGAVCSASHRSSPAAVWIFLVVIGATLARRRRR
jgi:cysteine-rich repeat protein